MPKRRPRGSRPVASSVSFVRRGSASAFEAVARRRGNPIPRARIPDSATRGPRKTCWRPEDRRRRSGVSTKPSEDGCRAHECGWFRTFPFPSALRSGILPRSRADQPPPTRVPTRRPRPGTGRTPRRPLGDHKDVAPASLSRGIAVPRRLHCSIQRRTADPSRPADNPGSSDSAGSSGFHAVNGFSRRVSPWLHDAGHASCLVRAAVATSAPNATLRRSGG